MADVDGARQRVSSWLTAITEHEDYVEGHPLHRLLKGELWADDLEALLEATAAPEKREPTLGAAKHRLRHRDPETSFWAACAVTPEHARELYRYIRATLSYNTRIGGLTDEELLAVMARPGQVSFEYTPSGVRSRRAELVDAGWVKDSGLKRKLASGRQGIVWEFVPEG